MSTCGVIWVHTVTRASLGVCGCPAEHTVTVTCSMCGTAIVSVCRFCWPSYSQYAMCNKHLVPLELRPVAQQDRAAPS